MPERVTDCGEAEPLSVMVSFAVKAAAAAGVNATYTVQDAAGASVAAQLFTWRKSVGLAPVMAMEVRSSVAVPALVRVTGSASEAVPWVVVGKASAVTLSLTEGAAAPVPVRVTFCGEPVALSVTPRVAVRAPAAAGLKATKMEQEAPEASDVPQPLRSTKEVVLAPLNAMELTVTAGAPVFLRVTTW